MVARSEPLTVLDSSTPPRLTPALEPNNVLFLRATGLSAGTYNIEATDSLTLRNWKVIGTLEIGPAQPAEFRERLTSTRPSRFYPTTGTVSEFTSDFFANGLGSKYSFQSYRAMFNKYGSLSKNQVLAYNAFFCATGGQPPFYGNCIYGTSNELRGYEAGRYLDRYMIATQLEYRLVLPKRFGLVGFGGIGAWRLEVVISSAAMPSFRLAAPGCVSC